MLEFKDILKAEENLKGHIKKTPITECPMLGQICGNQTFLKLENLQTTGSFKLRGALNKISNLPKSATNVIASSAGNHAQGVALSAKARGIKATIVMPITTPLSKISATKSHGAQVVLEGNVYDEAYAHARKIQEKTGAIFIHPFDDEEVIAGQGTIALEVLNEVPDIDIMIVPIGGGGIIAGIAKAAKSINKDIKIIGVEPINAASMSAALKAGHCKEINTSPTIADGIAVRQVGEKTLEIAKKYVDEIITVSEDEIAAAILFLMQRSKVVAEGAGATPVAALLAGKIKEKNKKICCVISGGNIDINLVERVLNRALINAGRRFAFSIRMADKVGQMAKLVNTISKTGANILSMDQTMYDSKLGITSQTAHFVLECFDESHKEEVKASIEANGHGEVIC